MPPAIRWFVCTDMPTPTCRLVESSLQLSNSDHGRRWCLGRCRPDGVAALPRCPHLLSGHMPGGERGRHA